jgi:mRNA interferase RelE/StbE
LSDYSVLETSEFLEQLAAAPAAERAWLRVKLDSLVIPRLRVQPHFHGQVVKLRGWSPETWRWRLGRWRAFYEIDEADRIVALTALSRRRDAY